MADRSGEHFGNYRLVRLLGQGGFAEVYLGQHVRLSLQVAIKVLHAHLSGQEAQHFQQEAETIAQMQHPAIVRILYSSETGAGLADRRSDAHPTSHQVGHGCPHAHQ